MPMKDEPVLACMSGGLDSTCIIGYLLEEGYEVYSYFVNRGQSNLEWERKSVYWYDNYFSAKYPNYKGSKEIELEVPSKSYKDALRDTKHLQDDVELRTLLTYPARNPSIFLAGMEYGYSLESKGVKIQNMFIAEHKDDHSIHGTLTLMRITNLMICYLLQDWDYQFISIPIERELGNLYSKSRLVRYADSVGLPLEHTRTCCDASEIQCGVCDMACKDRRMAFKNAGVKDKTEYQNPLPEDGNWRQDNKDNWKGKR